MDFYSWIPRTIIAIAYPLFSTLETVLQEDIDAAFDWLKYWAVFGIFSFLELVVDPVIESLSYSYPPYLIFKCGFLIWCMVPAEWNGSLIIFDKVMILDYCLFFFLFLIFQIIVPLYQMNQNNIEETADIAKINIKDRLEMVLRRDKFEVKRL